jgi:hypothetical protein
MKTIVLLLALTGCTGHVVMTPEAPSDLSSGKDVEGVLVTRAIPAIEIDEYTQITVPGAKASTSSLVPTAPITSGLCTPVQTRKLVTIPDPNHLWRLHYVPGLLEAHTFGMTMDASGDLLSINSQSTPDAGKTLSTLSGIAVQAQKMAVGATPTNASTLPHCTTGASLVGFESAYPLMRGLQ